MNTYDFSGISEEKGIALNTVVHKTSIKIDERGADGAGNFHEKPLISTNAETASYEFIVDHPFLFIIWEQKTDSIISLGRLVVP